MVEASIHDLVPESPEQEFGLVGGPLGHLADERLDEAYFNASLWEDLRGEEIPGEGTLEGDLEGALPSIGSGKELTLQL